jgi:hypothetical protein
MTLPDPKNLAREEEFLRLFARFSHTSAIGFGICDRQLHYQSINHALATSNGIPVRDHLGRRVRDILGEGSLTIEPTLRHVLDSGEITSREVAAKIPGRKETVHWIANYFPGKGPSSMTKQVAVITVEITEMKKLEQFVGRLANPFVGLQSKHTSQAAQEVRDAIEQYFVVLSGSIGRMTRQIWQADRAADEHLAPTIELLDQRVARMRNLVSEMANRCPLDEQQ